MLFSNQVDTDTLWYKAGSGSYYSHAAVTPKLKPPQY